MAGPFFIAIYTSKVFSYNYLVRLAFLLHLYQPTFQDESTFRKIADFSYLPLLKLIKNKKKLKITLNTPLSLLEQMESYGYFEWIRSLKELVSSGRVELTGSAAYHPLLTRLPDNFVEKQIVLNEYGLGYYFGRHSGFEGEASILVKDLCGFFPPELAVNENVLNVLEGLGYSWVVADETAVFGAENLSKAYGVFNFEDRAIRFIIRNRDLSNLLSFKRSLDTSDFVALCKMQNKSAVVSLDGEVFGYHYKSGIIILDTLIDDLLSSGIELVTVSEYLSEEEERRLENITESTWGATDEDMLQGNLYPMWDIKGNKLQELQWGLFNKLVNVYKEPEVWPEIEGMEILAVWNKGFLGDMHDADLKKLLLTDITVNQALNSDQFWWASNVVVAGQLMYSPDMVARSLEAYRQAFGLIGNLDINLKIEEIKNLL